MPTLQSAEAQLAGYRQDLPGLINKLITESRAKPLEAASAQVGRDMAAYLPGFMGATEAPMVGGTTSADLTPAQKLQYMTTRSGELFGNIARSGSQSEYLGGNRKEAINQALTAADYGLQRDTNMYQRALERLRAEQEQANFEKQLALSRAGMANQQPDWEAFLAQLGVTNNLPYTPSTPTASGAARTQSQTYLDALRKQMDYEKRKGVYKNPTHAAQNIMWKNGSPYQPQSWR